MNHNTRPDPYYPSYYDRPDVPTQPLNTVQQPEKSALRRLLTSRVSGATAISLAATGVILGSAGVIEYSRGQTAASEPAVTAQDPGFKPMSPLVELSASDLNALTASGPEGLRQHSPEDAARLARIGETVLSAAANGSDDSDPVLLIRGDEAMTKDPSSALLSGVALDTVTMGNASGKYDDVKFSYNVAEDQTLPTNDAMLTVQAAVVNHEEEH